MTRHELGLVSVSPAATLRDVLQVIDSSALAVALVVAPDQRLVGLLTDGDVRRALLGGADLGDPARPFATASPQTVSAGSGRAKVLDLMRALRIAAVPEVDDGGHLVGLHTLSDVIGVEPLPNPAVIMAGGRGTRLGGLTRDTPKPLMEVADRSILEWIVLNLVGGGVRDIQVSVNHLADQIEEHLGDGSRLGCRVTYLREEPDLPLGTAGSLALFRAAHPDLDVPTLVLNGDLMFRFEPERLLDFHAQSGASVSVATRPYQHEVPFGVVETDPDDPLGVTVTSIQEKPVFTGDVNAGVYAVSPAALDLVEPGVPSTMPDLIQTCLDIGAKVAAWPLRSDWIDVGTPFDLARAKGHV